MSTPDLDVIVCVRNRVHTLGRTLDSIRHAIDATELFASVLVLDGGSTDGSLELARTHPDVHVVAQLGRGLASARTQALAMTTAPLVAWLDSDDVWPPDSLVARVASLHDDPSVDLVTGAVAFESTVTAPPDRYRDHFGRIARGLTPGAWLGRRATYATVGAFDSRLRIGSDSDWFTRAVDARCHIVELDQVVLVKGIGSDNASHDVATYRAELLEIVRRHHQRRNTEPRGRAEADPS